MASLLPLLTPNPHPSSYRTLEDRSPGSLTLQCSDGSGGSDPVLLCPWYCFKLFIYTSTFSTHVTHGVGFMIIPFVWIRKLKPKITQLVHGTDQSV